MRSTQFDEYFPFEEEREEHPVRNQGTFSKTTKRSAQVTLYGEVSDLLSHPVSAGENPVFVDSLKPNSGQARSVSITPAIARMAKKSVTRDERFTRLQRIPVPTTKRLKETLSEG